MRTSHYIKHFLVEFLGCIITAAGAAGCTKIAIGVGAWDGLTVSCASLAGLKLGTMGMILNISAVFVQLLLLRKNFKPIKFLQIPLAVLLGTTINFFYYSLYASLNPEMYAVRFLFFLLFVLITSVGVSVVMSSGMIGMCLEGACMAVHDKYGFNFGRARQLVDIVSIILILILWYFVKAPLSLREGTIIMALIFGPALNVIMKYIRPLILRFVYGTNAQA